jgi:hypothetical protein
MHDTLPICDEVPGGQFVHAFALTVLENVFDWQSKHDVAPVTAWYFPGKHGMQETEPILLVYVPVEQGVRGALAPAQVYPGWQTV